MRLKLFIIYYLIFLTSINIHSQQWKNKKIEFYINPQANINSEKSILESFNKWQIALNHQIRFVYKGRNSAGIKRDHKNTISFITEWPQNLSKTLIGYTNLWYQKGKIIEADIILNQELYQFTVHPELITTGRYYLETILLHEIGHLLGLKHSNKANSIMKFQFKPEETADFPIDPESIELVKKIYHIK